MKTCSLLILRARWEGCVVPSACLASLCSQELPLSGTSCHKNLLKSFGSTALADLILKFANLHPLKLTFALKLKVEPRTYVFKLCKIATHRYTSSTTLQLLQFYALNPLLKTHLKTGGHLQLKVWRHEHRINRLLTRKPLCFYGMVTQRCPSLSVHPDVHE